MRKQSSTLDRWTWSQRCIPQLYVCTSLGWPLLHRFVHSFKWKKQIIIVKSTLFSTGQILSQPNFAFSFLVHLCLPLRVLIFHVSFLEIYKIFKSRTFSSYVFASLLKNAHIYIESSLLPLRFMHNSESCTELNNNKKKLFGDKADVSLLVGFFSSYQHMV